MRAGLARLAVFILAVLLLAPSTGAARPLSFVLDTPQSRLAEAVAISSQLARIGVRVELRIRPRTELRQAAQSGEVEACLSDWGSAFFDPFDLAQPKLKTRGRGNFSFYSNPRVDALLDKAAFDTDPSKRKSAYRDVQRIVKKQVPWVFGYIRPIVTAALNTVENLTPSLDGRINLHDTSLTRGDTLVVGMDVDHFQSLDPAMHRSRPTETVIRNLFDGLVTRTPKGQVVPQLATGWEPLSDTQIAFTLRQGVTFHDGSPLTADDVVYTFTRVLTQGGVGGATSPRRNLLGPLLKVEKTGARTVLFTLANPFPPLLQALVHFQIVPKRRIAAVGDAAFARHPVGTGPFRFVGGDLKTEVVMQPHDGYYGGSPELPPVGPARIKRVVFRAVPNAFDRVEGLLDRRLSVIQNVPDERVDQLEIDGAVRLYSLEGTRSFQMELNNARPPFSDIRVRLALNLAVDWDAIINEVYAGRAQRLATCFLPSGFGFADDVAPHPHDPELARLLLLEAGFDTTPAAP